MIDTFVCGAPMLGGKCVTCGGTSKSMPREHRKTRRASPSGGRVGPRSRTPPTGPIPERVNTQDDGGNTSLPNYFGYTTNKSKKGEEEYRRGRLMLLIDAELESSGGNSRYIELFGPPSSNQRISAIIALFEKQVRAHYYVKGPEHRMWTSLQKKKSDIQWLESIID